MVYLFMFTSLINQQTNHIICMYLNLFIYLLCISCVKLFYKQKIRIILSLITKNTNLLKFIIITFYNL